MIKPHIPRWLKIIAAAYAIYLALVLIVATPLLNIFAPKIYREQTGAELTLEHIIWINPFTLGTTIHKASSTLKTQPPHGDRNPFWSFDELDINFSLASVWRGHLVLDKLALRGFDVQIVQTAPDRFNFSDILTYRAAHFPQRPAAASDTSNEPFAIEIEQFEFTARHLGYRAPYAAEPLNASLDEVRFALANLSTVREKSADTGAAIFFLQGNHFLGDVKTSRVEFLREQHAFSAVLHDFKLIFPEFFSTKSSAYELSLRDDGGGNLNLKGAVDIAQSTINGHAALHAINVLPAWQYLAHKLAFDMSAAHLDGNADYTASWGKSDGASAFNYQLTNGKLALRNVQMQARNDSASRVGFETLQINNIIVDSTQPRAQIGSVLVDKLSVAGWNKESQISLVDMFAFAGDDTPSDSPPWHIQAGEIAVQNSDIRWRANQIDHLPLTLSPFNARLTNLHWPDDAPLQIDVKTTLNDTAQIAVNGAITSNSLSGELITDVRNLPLIWGDVFVRQQMRAALTSGALNTRTKITIDHAQPVSVQSDGAIDRFELHPLAQQTNPAQTVADSRKLAAWEKLEWQQLTLDPVKQRLNIRQIIAVQPWVQFRINTDGTNNFQQLMMQESTASSPAERGKPNQKAWQVAVDNIHIDRAAIDFRDASLTSAFRTNITGLSGDISHLDTSSKIAKNRAAKVALKGTVDGYAPIAITGTFNPFAAQPALNITLDITNLDLATLTPYSGTYAGYRIDGGRLSVQMAYTLDNNRIKGTNHIVVNQMQLGEQVRGPKVMELPLRLAIYLLTDSNGVMDLGVDVTGNVDDPDFSVGSIIWKAFRNLIVKTATSPFKALARLTGSDRDDLDRIEFESGSSQLASGENEKLQSIRKALEQKPALRLNILGHVSPSRDLEALRDNSLSAQLITQGGIKPIDIQQQSKNWQREVVKLFKDRFPDDKNALEVMQMNDAMRDNIELAPGALQDLAAERALAVKQMLVTEHGLPADRVFVKPTDLGADKNLGAFATFAVE